MLMLFCDSTGNFQEMLWPVQCTLQKLERKYHLLGHERERLVPVDADVCVWVYRGTVYSAEGTT
jgi:hypothetical protein